MAAYEVLLLNTAVPQIQAAQAGDTYVVPRDIAVTADLSVTGNTTLGNASTDTVQVNGIVGQGVAPTGEYGYRMSFTGQTGTAQYGFSIDAFGSSAATSVIVSAVEVPSGATSVSAEIVTLDAVLQFAAASNS